MINAVASNDYLTQLYGNTTGSAAKLGSDKATAANKNDSAYIVELSSAATESEKEETAGVSQESALEKLQEIQEELLNMLMDMFGGSNKNGNGDKEENSIAKALNQAAGIESTSSDTTTYTPLDVVG